MRRRFLATLFLFAITAGAAVPVSGQTSAQGTEVRLDVQLRRRLNTFFSNFAEAGIDEFRSGRTPAGTLIRFGVLHNSINADHRFERVPGREHEVRIPARQIEATIRKYFGISVPRHESVTGDYDWIRYLNGYYIIPAADGETYPFAQVMRLQQLPNREYIAWVNVYQPGDPAFENVHGTEEEWRHDGEMVVLVARMRAWIRQLRENGEARFVLLEYVPAR